MKKTLFLLLFATAAIVGHAQEPLSENQAPYARHSITVGGAAIVGFWETFLSVWTFSIPVTYEYRWLANKNNSLALLARGGFGNYTNDWGPELAVVGLAGKKSHHLMLTSGVIFPIFQYGGPALAAFPFAELGYRYQRPQGGFVWRVHVGTTGLGLGAGWAF